MAGDKKGKKGTKDKKDKKDKKEKKSKVLPIREAILTYSLSQKEQELEEIQYQLHELQLKCDRDKERNERLKEEQEVHLHNLLSQVHKQSSVSSDEVSREQVLEALRAKMAAERDEQRQVQELLEEMRAVDAESAHVNEEMDRWKTFANEGTHALEAAIQQLRKEMADMAETTEDMLKRMRRDFEQTQKELHARVGEDVEQRQAKALKYAERFLDKYTRQEFKSNGWLREEAHRTRSEYQELAHLVATMEKDNLAIMSQLVECHVEDLRVRRKFFLTDDDDDEEDTPADSPSSGNTIRDQIRAQGRTLRHATSPSGRLVRPFAAKESTLQPEDAATVQLQLLTLQGTRMQPRQVDATAPDSDWPVTRPMLQQATHRDS